jgi:hypothetical protein
MAVAEPPVVDDATERDTERDTITVRVRVYTYPADGKWYADVPELSLIAVGDDPRAAKDALLPLVMAYLQTVLSRGWTDQIRRPASLRHRVEVKLRVALARLQRRPAFVRLQLVHI